MGMERVKLLNNPMDFRFAEEKDAGLILTLGVASMDEWTTYYWIFG